MQRLCTSYTISQKFCYYLLFMKFLLVRGKNIFVNTYPVSNSVSFLIQRRHKPKTFANSINTSLGFWKFEFFPRRFLVLIWRRQMIIAHFLMKCHTQSRRDWRNNPNPICGAAPTNFMLLSEMSHKLFRLKKKWLKRN